jgi:hypothetical protein
MEIKRQRQQAIKEMMETYDDKRAEWVFIHGSPRGFDGWFTNQAKRLMAGKSIIAPRKKIDTIREKAIAETPQRFEDWKQSVTPALTDFADWLGDKLSGSKNY